MQVQQLGTDPRRDLLRILVITCASAMFGVLYGLVLAEGVRFGLINGVLNGVMIGLLDAFWVRRRRGRRLRRLPLLSYALVLSGIWVVIITVNMTLVRHWLDLPHDLSLDWMWDSDFWRHFLFCLFMAFTFNLLLRIIAFLGSRSLVEILLGRFQEPAEQRLVFMFLDVIGSTRLTERVGDRVTQVLIGELFFELAGLVERYGGEVHRYIGDEMVVTWRMPAGQPLPDVLGCLAAIRRVVAANRARNETRLGAWVDLRAGIHAGPVLVSEVGDQKRELVYFGDTINVSAGLQGLCKEEQCQALISAELFQQLELPPSMRSQSLGERVFKGKQRQVACVALWEVDAERDTSAAVLA